MTPEQMVGKCDLDFLPDRAQAEKFMRDDQEVINSGQSKFVAEESLTDTTGCLRVLQTLKIPFVAPDGQPAVMGVAVDITGLKHTEAALRESEERYRSLFRDNHAVMMMVDPNTGEIVDANPAAARFYGWSQDELRQKLISEINQLPLPGVIAEMQRIPPAGGMQFFFQHLLADGSFRDVEVFSGRLTSQGRELLYSIVHDVTERKRAGTRLEMLNQCLVNFGPDPEENINRLVALLGIQLGAAGALYTRLEGAQVRTVGKWNVPADFPTGENTAGCLCADAIASGDARPKVIRDLQHSRFAETDPAVVRFELHTYVGCAVILEGAPVGSLCAIFRDDRAVSPEDLNLLGIVASAVGVEEKRQRLEAQYQQAQKMEAIGQLAGGVAHDFNNILTSILMQIELSVMDDKLSAEIREAFRQIHADAERAANLTRQLLLFSRRQVMQSCDLDLNEIVTHIAKMLRRIIGEDVRLQLNLHASPLLSHADAGMLDQVLMNMVVNARDAMPHGGSLTITTTEITLDEPAAQKHPGAAPGRYVGLCVSDTGSGIPPEVLPHIFEPFFTTKSPGKGTGLGLATVFGIVEQHRGWIAVESTPGLGTTFRVFFPASAPAAALASQKVTARQRGGSETILLAEDEFSVRKIIRAILVRNGYQVLAAASGAEALKIWETHRDSVALLLTDLVMPAGMSGQDIAHTLQAEKPGLKVVYISGYSAEIAGREIELRAGENFVQKPFQADNLLRVIRTSLDGETLR